MTSQGTCTMGNEILYILPYRIRASSVMRELRRAGFLNCDLSVPIADTRDYGSRVLRSAAVCAVAGGVLGGTLGWVLGLSSLSLSGAESAGSGTMIPLLIGGSVGAAAGSLVGSLIGLGLPFSRAHLYLNRIQRGSVLVSVHAVKPDETASVERILQRAGGARITTAGGVASP